MKLIFRCLFGALNLPLASSAEPAMPAIAIEPPQGGVQLQAAGKSAAPAAKKAGPRAPTNVVPRPRATAKSSKAAQQSKPPVIDMGCSAAE